MINSPGLLMKFLLYPLLYTVSSAAEGVVIAIGVLLIYPFMSIIAEYFRQKINSVESVYIISFLGISLGSSYILVIGMIDWDLYMRLRFLFPASMTVSALLLSWLGSQNDQEFYESTHFFEALVSALLVLIFTFSKDFFLHGALDLRFGGFGDVHVFGGQTPFKAREVIHNTLMRGAPLSPLFNKAMVFWGIALLFAVLDLFRNPQNNSRK